MFNHNNRNHKEKLIESTSQKCNISICHRKTKSKGRTYKIKKHTYKKYHKGFILQHTCNSQITEKNTKTLVNILQSGKYISHNKKYDQLMWEVFKLKFTSI